MRLRVWTACLAGTLIAVLAIWWVAGTQLTIHAEPARLLAWLVGAGALGLVVGMAAAFWLDRGIVVHLRGLTRGFASGRVQELRGLPSASGWGEISEITEWAAIMITRQRVSSRAAQNLEQLEASVARALGRLETWRVSERWEPIAAEPGPAGAFARELNETFMRAAELSEQNFEAARRVHGELRTAVGDARESASQAERGFVEATALLTTVRELQRLAHEMRLSLATRAAEPHASAVATAPAPAALGAAADERIARYRESVETAIGELMLSSNESILHLGAALRRVQEIASQVQIVSQRATLVALHAVALESRLPQEDRRGEDLSRDLRLLTSEVRVASQHADSLAEEVERETLAADDRMREVRERVASRLEPPMSEMADAEAAASASVAGPFTTPPSAEAAASRPEMADAAARLLERVREMIQDATQKGERLSSGGERASRTAERLLRRLEEEVREMEGLMVRLAPAGEEALAGDAAAEGFETHAAPAELRLIEEAKAPVEPAIAAAGAAPEDDAGDVELDAREERP